MADDQIMSRFVSGALDAGIPHDAVVGLLLARGWRERQIYKALGQHYSDATGLVIPSRPGSGAGAKDAFFYLLTFSTLATWTCALGSLAFRLIDRWLADPLFSMNRGQFETYEITWALAAILVAFPLYLLVSRAILHEAAADPDKLDSGIRKWLTYLALVIAACVFMGDLIAALAYLLRGELTSRFLAKSFVVLALSGGVFFYYFGGLRKTEAATPHNGRDRRMAILSSIVVIVMLVLGFLQLGTPSSQREVRADAQRVQHLYQMSSLIKSYWSEHASQLPTSLTDLPGGAQTDPITHAQYEYLPGSGSQYQLCATFALAARNEEVNSGSAPWSHPAGHYCFSLDATAITPYPIQPYPYQ